LVVVPLVAAALFGAVAAVSGRGADDAFLLRQKNPTRVTTPAVERLMLTAPDPMPPHESRATRSRCRTEGRRELRNPWRCTVNYRSGSVARYLVTIGSDGSYRARYLLAITADGDRSVGGTAMATGCCLRVPAAE
jgi:hypothetical protein